MRAEMQTMHAERQSVLQTLHAERQSVLHAEMPAE
jgi:hypothetical protein